VAQLGANAFGEVLEAGRVPDCYLGLRLDLSDHAEQSGVLVVARPRCCTRMFPSRAVPRCTSL
jgi:hypothetical protein